MVFKARGERQPQITRLKSLYSLPNTLTAQKRSMLMKELLNKSLPSYKPVDLLRCSQGPANASKLQ
jgi:hypothetical protein